MIRTNEPHEIIDEFSGVNDRVDQVKLPKDLVGWSHGVFPNALGVMARIPGKLLFSTGVTTGPTLSITNLVFTDLSVVVVHTSTVLMAHRGSVLLNSSSSSVSPLSGFISP